MSRFKSKYQTFNRSIFFYWIWKFDYIFYIYLYSNFREKKLWDSDIQTNFGYVIFWS